SVGSDFADGALRRCLAMGVDRGIRIEAEVTDPIAIGHALAHVARRESPSLVLCGAQSSDSVQGSTGGALAGLLDLPCVAVVRELTWDPANGRAIVERELEGGLIEML